MHKFSVYSRLELAKKLGYSKAIVNILKGNLYSEKSYKGLGFIKNLVYYYVHILNFKKTLLVWLRNNFKLRNSGKYEFK